jgi:hypothetical protein
MWFILGFLLGFFILVYTEWMVPVTETNGQLTTRYKKKWYILVEADVKLPND